MITVLGKITTLQGWIHTLPIVNPEQPPQPALSVIICSLNGAEGVDRCLHALKRQTIRSSLEIIVVDDGSVDDTSIVAQAHGVTVIRHSVNRGVSAGRNSGIEISTASIIAFLDDDCEPEPSWAERILEGYQDESILGVGGQLVVGGGSGFVFNYLTRHNPLIPQELSLAASERMLFRLFLYLRRQWESATPYGRRDVYSVAAANMSLRRQVLLDVGGFDERIDFASEDEDLCRRLRHACPKGRLLFLPEARVIHHFKRSLRDTLRRRKAYGCGAARMFRKWPSVAPTFFPWPVLELTLLGLAPVWPPLAIGALVLPFGLYPQGLRAAASRRNLGCLLDPFIQLAEEFCANIGFIEGLWQLRNPASDEKLIAIRNTDNIAEIRSGHDGSAIR